MIRARVDRSGIQGPNGTTTWDSFPTDGRVRWPFARRFENFRHLDPLSRIVSIAVESLGVEFDPGSAIVLATSCGSLYTDRQFEKSRHEELRPALFPYTLPSAPIAAVAIRHHLTGPGLCLCLREEELPRAFDEARLLLETKEAPAAIVCVGDVVPPDRIQLTACYLTP